MIRNRRQHMMHPTPTSPCKQLAAALYTQVLTRSESPCVAVSSAAKKGTIYFTPASSLLQWLT